ncbi:MAG: hypothetical protein INQ03_12530 [Candidatus Heimdallarchaeota archaeon]|nr:hypothetical protein [Candidatus Heimdallarchaeota archaeon]
MSDINEFEVQLTEIVNEEAQVGPKHKNWQSRLKLEMSLILQYLNYIKDHYKKLWFDIRPNNEPKWRGILWEGNLKVRELENNLPFIILITSEYPKVSPRILVDEIAIKHFRCLYPSNDFIYNEKRYVNIDHGHFKDQWRASYNLVHVLDRILLPWLNCSFMLET